MKNLGSLSHFQYPDQILGETLDTVDSAEVHPTKKLHPEVAVEKLTIPISSVSTVQPSITASVAFVTVVAIPEGAETTTLAEWVDSIFESFPDSPFPTDGLETTTSLVSLPASSKTMFQSQSPIALTTMSDQSEPSEIRVSNSEPSSQALRTLEVVRKMTLNVGSESRSFKIPSSHKIRALEAQVCLFQGSQSEISQLKNEMITRENQIKELTEKSLRLEKFEEDLVAASRTLVTKEEEWVLKEGQFARIIKLKDNLIEDLSKRNQNLVSDAKSNEVLIRQPKDQVGLLESSDASPIYAIKMASLEYELETC
ncbi:hypothetical protein TIFTF001_031220 [Ficus carica]|uniref:Uncharacterized protein n=1 Tax=Ficus carica TaxID=3494 RepID=A0AA88DUF8_FICCA|nr:hypothetical protein TIFTF001_031220 [Ficus carica]